MKKGIKNTLLATALSTTLLLTGCGQEMQSDNNPIDNISFFKNEGMNREEKAVIGQWTDVEDNNAEVVTFFEFNKDQTFSMAIIGLGDPELTPEVTGKYKIVGDKLYIGATTSTSLKEYTDMGIIKQNGNKLLITIVTTEPEGVAHTFLLTKYE